MEEVIRDDLISGNYRRSTHFRKDRANQRNITRLDIKECAETAFIKKGDADTYLVMGTDADGDDLTLVCAYDEGTLIITGY